MCDTVVPSWLLLDAINQLPSIKPVLLTEAMVPALHDHFTDVCIPWQAGLFQDFLVLVPIRTQTLVTVPLETLCHQYYCTCCLMSKD
jgi:hypothetical protein